MRLAYADPPYPGHARLYEGHPDYAGEVDHYELVARLRDEYDGWALSTNAESLGWIIPLCGEHRVLAWVKHTISVGWEPVIVSPARKPDRGLRDWLQVEPDAYQWRGKPAGYVIGQKPEPFCLWVFAWLGANGDDILDDLFPGSGNVGRAWDRWRVQPTLPIARSAAAEGRAERRALVKALAEHETLPVGGVIPTPNKEMES